MTAFVFWEWILEGAARKYGPALLALERLRKINPDAIKDPRLRLPTTEEAEEADTDDEALSEDVPVAEIWAHCKKRLTPKEVSDLLPRAVAECWANTTAAAVIAVLQACVRCETPCPTPLLNRILRREESNTAPVLVEYLARFRVDDGLEAFARVLARTVNYRFTLPFRAFASWRGLSRALLDEGRMHNRTFAAALLGAMPMIDPRWVHEQDDAVFCTMAKRVQFLPREARPRLRGLIGGESKALAHHAMTAALKNPTGVFPLDMSYEVFLRRINQGFFPTIGVLLPRLYAADADLAAWLHGTVASYMPEYGDLPLDVSLRVDAKHLARIPAEVWAWMARSFISGFIYEGAMVCPKLGGPMGACTKDHFDGTYTVDGTRRHLYDMSMSAAHVLPKREMRANILLMWSRALLSSPNIPPRGFRDALAALAFVARHADLMGNFQNELVPYLMHAALRAPDLYKRSAHAAVTRLRFNPHALAVVAQFAPAPPRVMDELDDILWKHGMIVGCRDVMEAVFRRQTAVTEWLARAFLEGPVLHNLPLQCPSPCRVALKAMASHLRLTPLEDDQIPRFLHFVSWVSRAKGTYTTGHEARIPSSEASFLEEVVMRIPKASRRSYAYLAYILYHNLGLLTPGIAKALLEAAGCDASLWPAVTDLMVRALTQPLPRFLAATVRQSETRKRTRSSDIIPTLLPDMARELVEMMGYAQINAGK